MIGGLYMRCIPRFLRGQKTLVALLLAASVVCTLTFSTIGFAASAKKISVRPSGAVRVEITDAAFDEWADIDTQNSSLSFAENNLSLKLAGIRGPGAGARIRVTVKNNGTLPARLESIRGESKGDYLEAVLDDSDLEIGDELGVGKESTFEFVARWNPDKDDLLSYQSRDDFDITLNYVNDTLVEINAPVKPPKTGEAAAGAVKVSVLFILAAVSGLVALICFIIMALDRRKARNNDRL